MTNWTEELFRQAIKKVKERAAEDKEFRELCVRDIHAAIKEEAGQEVPSDLKINVVDNTGYQLCIELPAPKVEEGELIENELEGISEGLWPPAHCLNSGERL